MRFTGFLAFVLAAILGGPWLANGLAGQTVDTVVVSLADVERMVLDRSPLLAPAVAALGLSRAQETRVSRARFLPEFNLRNTWGVAPKLRGEFTEFGVLVSPDTMTGLSDLTWFTQVDLNIVQPLYTFGKIGSQMDAARFQVEASQAELSKTQAELVLQARRIYWGVVLGNELARVVTSVNDRVVEAEERLQERFDEGSATQNDMFKFRIFQYEVASQSREVEAGRAKARAGLRAVLRIPKNVPFRVEAEALEPVDVTLDSLATYVAAALTARPEVKQLQAGINARRSLVRAAEKASWPTLFVAGQIKFNAAPGRFDPRNPFVRNPTNFFRPGIVLGLDWDLNFFQNSDKTALQRYETAKLEAQVYPLELMIEQQVREAYVDAVRARADMRDGRRALRASENLLRAELQTFDIGLGGIEEVIDAFKANVGMTLAQFKNIATLNSRIAELSQRVGREIR
ncbi:MAG: TolC family protein [Gemmatimonadota bacterium]|nr:MAG: TolC family protein [Gemmatimonadota bacterium]